MTPELWTELEYAAALKRHRELRRQHRWKEAGTLLGYLQRAVQAELFRASGPAQTRKIADSSRSVSFFSRHRNVRLHDPRLESAAKH